MRFAGMSAWVRATAVARREEHGLPSLREEVAAVVARGAVDAETDRHARREVGLDGRDAGPEAHVGRGAVRDSGAG
jgi:hypothetical protein